MGEMNMDTEIKTKTRTQHPERVTLNQKSLDRINGWLGQLNLELKGIKISRSDLVDWLLSLAKDKLSPALCKDVKKNYYDEVKFHEWAMKEFKAARARGESITYAEIIGNTSNSRSETNVSTRIYRKKSKLPKTNDAEKLETASFTTNSPTDI
jgi:hypothetical protein